MGNTAEEEAKQASTVSSPTPDDAEQQLVQVFAETIYGDTQNDKADMQRLGKKQEFKRNFNFISTLGFISIYMATWEYVLVSLSLGLLNGGFGGLWWTWCGTVTCYASIVASLAEMESMAPTSGGQYHWVSEFAPPRYQRFLSYAAGWMSTLGWLASFSSSVFVLATLVEVLVNITYPNFVLTNWAYTLIMLGFIFITIFFNTWGAGFLPALQTWSLYGHILGFFVVVIPLWVMCRPLNNASEVFTSVVNSGGWSSAGTACLVGQTAVMYCNLGSDSAVHISEEVEDAGLVVPRVMWLSYLFNVFLGTIMLITMLFCIGPLDAALDADAPYLNLFTNTGSTALALALTIILFFLVFAGNITALATTSREVWAFSRDKGLPFSRWISKMEIKRHIPFNSVYLTSVASGILCLVNMGSTFAFNIIISLVLLALLSTYMISIGCVFLKRFKGEKLPPARWSMGRYGIFVNGFAFVYAAFVIVFSCFPVAIPVTSTSAANWAPAVWVGVMALSGGFYIFYGTKHFTAPVVFVEGHRQGVAVQTTDTL